MKPNLDGCNIISEQKMLTQAVVVTLFVDASLPGWLYSCCGELMEIETHEGATADTKNIPTILTNM